MKTRNKTKPIPAVGTLPYGYDKAKKGQDKSCYYPDKFVLTKLDEAIVQIREGRQPVRKVVVGDKIHGREMAPYLDFYPVQIEALKALVRAVCEAHNIPFGAPLDDSGELVRGVDKRVTGRSFSGIVGHYHLNEQKTDPGRLPLDEIAKELREE